jgi:putative transposase
VALQFAPSTYYAVKARHSEPSARARRDAWLLVEIQRVHEHSDGTYGAEKVWRQLRREGFAVARCTVERLMRRERLEGVRRTRKRRATIPDHSAERPRDLVDRDFTAVAPNRLWVSDFTYVMRGPGSSTSRSPSTRSREGSSAGEADTSMRTELVLDTLEMAL